MGCAAPVFLNDWLKERGIRVSAETEKSLVLCVPFQLLLKALEWWVDLALSASHQLGPYADNNIQKHITPLAPRVTALTLIRNGDGIKTISLLCTGLVKSNCSAD